MKRLLRTMLLVTLICPTSLVFAHSDHGTISQQTVKQIAAKSVQQMTFKDMGYQVGKLDAIWKSAQTSDVEILGFSGEFYQLRVTNRETRQRVYLKVAVTGQVLDATENPGN